MDIAVRQMRPNCLQVFFLTVLLLTSAARAQVITDVYSPDVEAAGISAIIGMVAAGDAGYLVTVGEIYRMSSAGVLGFEIVATIPASFGITAGQSSVAIAPGDGQTFVYTTRFGRGWAATVIKPFPPESAQALVTSSWYGFVPNTQGQWVTTDTQYAWFARPDMVATLNNPDGLVSPAGIYRMSLSDGSYTSFGQSGAGQISQIARATALSLEGLLYVLDYGNLRIASYDPYSGDFLGGFAIPAETSPTALAYANGRLYTANGNGGGWIYDASTGDLLGQFQATDGVVTTATSSVIAVTSDGTILLADANTGFHAFYDTASPVPEPATWILGAAGVAVALLWRRKLA